MKPASQFGLIGFLFGFGLIMFLLAAPHWAALSGLCWGASLYMVGLILGQLRAEQNAEHEAREAAIEKLQALGSKSPILRVNQIDELAEILCIHERNIFHSLLEFAAGDANPSHMSGYCFAIAGTHEGHSTLCSVVGERVDFIDGDIDSICEAMYQIYI